MEPIFIDKNDFYELVPDIYCLNGSEITGETELHKYVDLSALIDIMDGHFKVALRKSFSDRQEKGELANPFCEHMLVAGYKATKEDSDRFQKYQELREQAGELPTSCFTANDMELYAMWKAFTTSYTGVRITTTITNFIQSLLSADNELQLKYDIFIGPVNYAKCCLGLAGMEYTTYLFNKNPCYQPEKEVRIYFIPKSTKDNPTELNLCINGEIFIKQLTLSPFLPPIMKPWLKKALEQSFPQLAGKIQFSSISESI